MNISIDQNAAERAADPTHSDVPASSGRRYTTYEQRPDPKPLAGDIERDVGDDEAITVRAVSHPLHSTRRTLQCKPRISLRNILGGVALATLVGCGTTTGDRAVSGAGIGAGAGAAIGAVTGIGVGTGAAIGAAAGAATGGLTDKKQIDLGTPVWRR